MLAAMTIDFVDEAARASGIRIERLDSAQLESVAERLKISLGVDIRNATPWDSTSAPEGKHRIDGWKLIPQFVGFSECLMFLGGAQVIWRLKSGKDLLQVLKECPAIEYYVCDESANYLLCNNHHDFVVAWGSAEPWLDRLG